MTVASDQTPDHFETLIGDDLQKANDEAVSLAIKGVALRYGLNEPDRPIEIVERAICRFLLDASTEDLFELGANAADREADEKVRTERLARLAEPPS